MDTNLTEAEQKKLATQATQEANKAIHDLVIKVINWKSGFLTGGFTKKTDKITSKEWQTYRKHLLTISQSQPRQKTIVKLNEIEIAIKKNGGFIK